MSDERSSPRSDPDAVPAAPPDKLSAEHARRILRARFTTAGMDLTGNYDFESGGGRIALEGYDAERKVGYVYIDAPASDAARDRVTEAAARTSRVATGLAAAGTVHILCVFENDVPTSEVLERRIDAFFAGLPR